MRTNVENTFTFIFPYLFNVFFSYPKRYLLVNKNQHWRSQFSKRNVCLSFTAFEEREVLIIPEYRSTILCFLRRSSIQIPDQNGLET